MSGTIKALTDADLTAEALQNKGIVLVDCWAAWCGPCRMLSPIVEEIAAQMPGITVGKLNIDDYTSFAIENGIAAIPTLLFFKDGVEVDRLIGLYPKEAILESINNIK